MKSLALAYTRSRAAQLAGITHQSLLNWERDDEEFAEQCRAAQAFGTQMLEDEARRRAFEGTLEPRMSKDSLYYVRRYSDTLLQLLMRARDPQRFGREVRELQGVNGAPLVPDSRPAVAIVVLQQGQALPAEAEAFLQKTLGST